MSKLQDAKLPPIAVDDPTEKLSLTVPLDLKQSIEEFARYFTDATGQRPTSFNAVAVGILTGYLQGHGGFQRWVRSAKDNSPRAKSAAAAASDGDTRDR